MDPNSLLPLVRKFFEHDVATAAQCLENITEKGAAEVLEALPPLSWQKENTSPPLL